MMDFNEFAESIKAKHPQYKDVDNLKLAKAMVEKYPQYGEKVTFEPEQPKGEFTPKPVEYNLENPSELAQAISQKEGIPFQEAQERVTGFPRRERAFMQGDNFPIVSTAFDVASAPARGFSGLTALLGGGDPMARMTQTKSAPSKGLWGGIGEFAENMVIDPLTPLGAGVSKAVSSGLTRLAPNLGRASTGALEGLATGSAEFGLEQAKRAETGEQMQGLGDYAMQAGGGSLLGVGGGKLGDAIQGRKDIREAPSVLKQGDEISLDIDPIKAEAKILDEVKQNTGFNTNQAKSVPMYAREMFSTIDNEGKKQLNRYISQGRLAVSDPSRVTPFDEVGKMFDRGEEALNQARKGAGSKMGEIEDLYLKGGEIKTQPIKERWGQLLAQYGNMTKEIAEDGSVSFKNAPNKTRIGKNLRVEFEDADEIISELGDEVTGERLRSLESALADIAPSYASSTRSGKMNSKADAGINSIISDMRDLTAEQIRKEGGTEALNSYKQAKKDYGKYWQAQDFLQRRLGLKIKDETGEEISTRGGSLVKAMTNSTQDRNAKSMARLIHGLTGEDIGKHATMAKFAMQTSGDTRAGFNRMPNMSKSGAIDAVLGWVGDKTLRRGQTPQTFEGMTELVQKAQPERQRTFLDLIQDNPVTNFGARGIENFGQPALRSGLRGLGGNDEQ